MTFAEVALFLVCCALEWRRRYWKRIAQSWDSQVVRSQLAELPGATLEDAFRLANEQQIDEVKVRRGQQWIDSVISRSEP